MPLIKEWARYKIVEQPLFNHTQSSVKLVQFHQEKVVFSLLKKWFKSTLFVLVIIHQSTVAYFVLCQIVNNLQKRVVSHYFGLREYVEFKELKKTSLWIQGIWHLSLASCVKCIITNQEYDAICNFNLVCLIDKITIQFFDSSGRLDNEFYKTLELLMIIG